jgi:hypothetical protein
MASAHVRNLREALTDIQTFRTLMAASDSRKIHPRLAILLTHESLNSLEYIHDMPCIFLFILMIRLAFFHSYS